MNPLPLFPPEVHIQTLCKKARSSRQIASDKLADIERKSFAQLSHCFRKFIPEHLLQPSKSGVNSRRRVFSKETTFWAFLSQVLCADGGCKEVLAKQRAHAALKGIKTPISTGSYCKARLRFPEKDLAEIFEHSTSALDQREQRDSLDKRRVIVVDGTGLTASDSAKNRRAWPQQKQQKPGCGFPSLRVCACFSLKTGGVLSYKIGNKKSHELRLFRKQRKFLRAGDILLGDKMFCNYFELASLKNIQVDSAVTLPANKSKPIKGCNALDILGENDLLIKWKRPVRAKKAAYSLTQWRKLPEELMLRQIKVTVNTPGFRVKSFYIITTLLDPLEYPAADLAELYFRRWEVELNFDDLKTTMGMDHLRCKTPSMVRKELMMYFIAYNAVRWLIYESSEQHGANPLEVSFKGAIQSVRQWEPYFKQPKWTKTERQIITEKLYLSVVQNTVLYRPNRREPRCLKRRPKPYQLLTAHRSKMKEIPHRSKYRAKVA